MTVRDGVLRIPKGESLERNMPGNPRRKIVKPARGKYIVIEGPDGSGKTVITEQLVERLSHRHEVKSYKTPSHEVIGELIRSIFDGEVEIDPKAMMYLFNADAIDLERKISRDLVSGHCVVLDRHSRISGCVYQTQFHSFATVISNVPAGIFRPIDLCVMLDARADTLAMRLAGREEKTTDKLYTETNEERLQVVRNRYRASRYLHADLVRDWMEVDTDELAAEDVARNVAIRLGL